MSLSGEIALVTGASRGIGRAIALELGSAGATVIAPRPLPRVRKASPTPLRNMACKASAKC